MALLSPSRQVFFIALLAVVILDSYLLLHNVSLADCSLFNTHSLQSLTNGGEASLAARQSYGFFDDIQDVDWRRMQKRAQMTATWKTKTMPTKNTQDDDTVVSYLNRLQPEFTCPLVTRVVVGGRGPQWTCDPHRLRKRKSCLIYSIATSGATYDYRYEWEEGLIELIESTHCEIHVFFTGGQARMGDPEIKNIHYHPWGIKSSLDGNETANMVSFPKMVERLGHQDRMVDVLRINCDKCEWSTYKDWVSANAGQILVETHHDNGSEWRHSPEQVAEFFNAFVTSNHFAMFSKEVCAHEGGNRIAFGFVKLHADFWNDHVPIEMRSVLSLESLPAFSLPEPPLAPYKIPRRLIFVHEKAVLKDEEPIETFFNVKRTIKKHTEAWGGKPPVWMLNEFTCLVVVHNLSDGKLTPIFLAEQHMAHKMDMCLVAALFYSGGFYFDPGFAFKAAYQPGNDVGLVVARDEQGLSKQFLACESNSTVMKSTFDQMMSFYQQNVVVPDFDLGKQALMAVFGKLDVSLLSEVANLKDVGEDNPPPGLVTVLPVESFENPVPVDMRGAPSPEHKIPRRLIFTDRYNILETKKPPLIYENVLNTIQKYRDAWGEPDAPVWFLDDTDCRSAIYETKPNLLPYFDMETDGSWKADICRVAALFLTGGYYFDVDMETIKPWIPDSNVSFATVMDTSKTRYFQSFLITEKQGRLIREALDEMVLFYENKKNRVQALLGPLTLKWAVDSVPRSDRGEIVIMQEEQSDIPLRGDAVGGGCDTYVPDPETHEVLFNSRVVGAGKSCVERNSPEGQTWVKEQADETLKLEKMKQKKI